MISRDFLGSILGSTHFVPAPLNHFDLRYYDRIRFRSCTFSISCYTESRYANSQHCTDPGFGSTLKSIHRISGTKKIDIDNRILNPDPNFRPFFCYGLLNQHLRTQVPSLAVSMDPPKNRISIRFTVPDFFIKKLLLLLVHIYAGPGPARPSPL